MKKIIFIVLGIVFFLISCTSNTKKEDIHLNTNNEKYNIAVLGLTNELNIEDWEDNRIGFGLRVKLSEILYETNKFYKLEEKDEIKSKIEELSKMIWISKKNDYKNYLKTENIDFIAYGRIYYFGKPRRNASIGLVQLNKNITEIKVEVTLENIKTGKKITEKGFGKAEVNANSVIFTFNQDKVEFDKTTVGIATEEALKEAVKNIIKKMKP